MTFPALIINGSHRICMNKNNDHAPVPVPRLRQPAKPLRISSGEADLPTDVNRARILSRHNSETLTSMKRHALRSASNRARGVHPDSVPTTPHTTESVPVHHASDMSYAVSKAPKPRSSVRLDPAPDLSSTRVHDVAQGSDHLLSRVRVAHQPARPDMATRHILHSRVARSDHAANTLVDSGGASSLANDARRDRALKGSANRHQDAYIPHISAKQTSRMSKAEIEDWKLNHPHEYQEMQEKEIRDLARVHDASDNSPYQFALNRLRAEARNIIPSCPKAPIHPRKDPLPVVRTSNRARILAKIQKEQRASTRDSMRAKKLQLLNA